MESKNKFDESKLKYLINDHYDGNKKKNNLINALNSFQQDCQTAEPDFYVGEYTLKNKNQCIAFFKVPKTQTDYLLNTNEAVYVQTSDNTSNGEIIGVYYANIDIGKENNKTYDIRCYYLKDRCYDGGVRELCGKVNMKLKTDFEYVNDDKKNKDCLSITGTKNFDFLHDVNASFGKENNTWMAAGFTVQDETYVRMFIKNDEKQKIKNDEKQKIEMQEFKTIFTIKCKEGYVWDSVMHEGLTKGKKAQKPLYTTPIPNENYRNPVMRDNNNGIKKEQVANKIETEIRFVTSKREQVIKSQALKSKSNKKQKDNNSIQSEDNNSIKSNSKKKLNKNKNNEIKIIDDNSKSKSKLDSDNIIKEIKEEQESINNSNLIKSNNDGEAEEKQDEELKSALEEIETLKTKIQTLQKEIKKLKQDLTNEQRTRTNAEQNKNDAQKEAKEAKERAKEAREWANKIQNFKEVQYNRIQELLKKTKKLKDEKNKELTEKNEKLEKQINELNEKIQIYEKNGMTLATKQSQAQQEYNSKIIALDRKYRTEIKTLNTNNEQLKEENEKLKEQVKDLELKLNKKYSDDAEKLVTDNKRLQQELEEIKKQLTQKTTWQKLIPDKQQVAITYNDNTLKKTNLKQHPQTQFSFQSNHNINTNINTKDKNEMVDLKKQIDQLTKTNEELNNEVKRQKTEIETTNNQNKEIQQINQALKEENEKYKESLEKANKNNKLLEDLRKANDDLSNKIVQQQKDIKENGALRMKMQALETNQQLKEGLIELKEQTIQKYTNKISELNTTLQSQQEMQKEINRKNKELQEKIEQYDEQMKRLNCTIKNTQETIKNSNKTNQTLERKKAELEITNKKLQEEIDKLKTTINTLTNENFQLLNTKLLAQTQPNNEAQYKQPTSQENKNDIDIDIRQTLANLDKDKLLEKAIDFFNIAQRNSTATQDLKERLEKLSRENEKQKENTALQQDNKKLLDTIKKKEEIITYLQADQRLQMKLHEETTKRFETCYKDLYQQNTQNIEKIKNLQQILNKQKEANPQTRDGDKNQIEVTKQQQTKELKTPLQITEMLKGPNQSNDKNQIELTSNLQYNTENKETKPKQQIEKLKENVKPKDKTTTQNLKIQYPQKQTKQYKTIQGYKGVPTYEIVPINNAYNNNNINALHPEIVKEEKNNEAEQQPINKNYINNYVPIIRDRIQEAIEEKYIKPYQNQMLENTNIIGAKEEQKNINLFKQNNFISPSNPQNQIHKGNNNDTHLEVLLQECGKHQTNAEGLLGKTGNGFRTRVKKGNGNTQYMYMRAVQQSSKWQQNIFKEEQKKKIENMYTRAGIKPSNKKPVKCNHNIVPKYRPAYNN